MLTVLDDSEFGGFEDPELAEHRELLRASLADESYWSGAELQRGVIICGGGERYLPGVWVVLQELRCLGCSLPVEIWYLGPWEMPQAWLGLFERQAGVFLMDAASMREQYPCRILNGWELKPYAILHSRFREVLLLDADNTPVRDPEYLFDIPEFRRLGAMFWPDYGRLEPERPIWAICGLPYRNEPEFETGQVLVNREICWKELRVTMHLNEYSDFYYRYVHGDKETFHLAWRMLGTPFVMPNVGIQSLAGTMCQHDLQGRRLFQHRNGYKWQLSDNACVEDFINEERCLGHIRQLSNLLGTVTPENLQRLVESQRDFIYQRIGYDQRFIALLPSGKIGDGQDCCERNWEISNGKLILIGDHGCIAELEWQDEVWSGCWLKFEKMPVRLVPARQSGAGLAWDPEVSIINLAILIPTVNRADLLRECMESMSEQWSEITRVFIIDNGSQSLASLENSKLQVCTMAHNIGVAASWNLGLNQLFLDPLVTHVVTLNDDITLHRGQIRKIKCVLAAHPDCWMFSGPFQWSVWAMSREGYSRILENTGYIFDEQFHPAYFEDNDFHYRLSNLFPGRYRGFIPALEPDEKRCTMSGKKDPRLLSQWQANLSRYIAKWGGPPGGETICPNPLEQWEGAQSERIYFDRCQKDSDIREHLPVLKKYASECSQITEFGMRNLVSTWAFLAAKPNKLVSYTISPPPNFDVAQRCATRDGVDFTSSVQDGFEDGFAISPTELLFIDTIHTYSQLKEELARHGNLSSKYIILHDTAIFGYQDEGNTDGPGLIPALEEFLQANPWWSKKEVLENNNGLTVLVRQPPGLASCH